MTSDGEIIREYSNRPRRYINIDGLFELYIGLWLLGMALLAEVGRLAPKPLRAAFVTGMVLYGPVLWFSLRALRHRVTERRTGYVQFRGAWPSKPHEWVLSGIATFVYLHDPFGVFSVLPVGRNRGPLQRGHLWLIVPAGSHLEMGDPARHGRRAAHPGSAGSESLQTVDALHLPARALWTIGGAITFSLYLRNSRRVSE